MSSKQTGQSDPHQYYDSVLAKYEPVIGLEIHCQLKTHSKLFCPCPTTFGALANQNTCPVCLGLPGVLPVLNKQAVDYAILMALAVNARIREKSIFCRKQYFYPDLPKGYQITQYDLPYCEDGFIVLASGKRITISRIHIEEDAGKNVHADSSSYVDLNRAGIPLLEIVSAPELNSPAEAHEYLRSLRAIVRYLSISDGNMEEGSIRCDANVSLRLRGSKELGTRTEIKNVNSFKNVERAITYEIYRQADLLDSGRSIKQATLQFDASTGKTQVMRSKEDSPDYRYFPDPDLGAIFLAEERVTRMRASLQELPEQKKKRFEQEFGLSPSDAHQLTEEKELSEYFEAVIRATQEKNVTPKTIANWLLSEFMREHNARSWSWVEPSISIEKFSRLLILLSDETISGKLAKQIFEEMAEDGSDPDSIISSKGLVQIRDKTAIEDVVRKVINQYPEQKAQYLSGKDKVFGFLVGQVMKESQGKFNPALVNSVLKDILHGSSQQS